MSARLIQIFWPLSRYASPSRRAVVWRLPASVPTPGLGETERRELLALRLGHEPALTLLLGPPLQECQRVQRDVHALDDTERRIGTLQLLAQDREADVVHPAAAVGFGDRGSEEALLPHPSEHLAVDFALRVPFADVRQDLGLCERSRGLLDELVLVGQREVHHGAHPTRRESPECRSVALDHPRYSGSFWPTSEGMAVRIVTRPAATLGRWSQPPIPHPI